MDNIQVSASQEAKVTIQQKSGVTAFCIEPFPPKRNFFVRNRHLFSRQKTAQIRALSTSCMTCIYAFLDDCTFPNVYDFHAGSSTEPETVAD